VNCHKEIVKEHVQKMIFFKKSNSTIYYETKYYNVPYKILKCLKRK